jgi:hypothetical protein
LILLEAFTGLGRQVKRLLRDWSPLAEDHWHGVAADTFMSHFAMLQARPDGESHTWPGAVADDDYTTANQQR